MDSHTVGLIEASFDAMLQTDENGIIQLVNQAAVDYFGWSREDLVGQNVSIIVGARDAEKHDEYIRRYLTTGEKRVMGRRRKLLARRKDGVEISIELSLTEGESKSGRRVFCAFIRDVSEKKKQIESLAYSEESFPRTAESPTRTVISSRHSEEHRTCMRREIGLIESSFDAMFQIDDSGTIQLVNQAAVDRFGWTREEFIGQNINIIVGAQHASKHDEYIQRYLATAEKRVMGKRRELAARRKDGSEFPIELGLTEVEAKSGEHLFCGFVRDLTRQKEDKDRIACTEERLARIAASLKKESENLKRLEENMTRKQIGLVESSFDAMFQINENGIIQLANQAAIDQFGWTYEEFIGKNIEMIVGAQHAGKHDEYMKRYLATGETRVMGKRRELSARRKDGSEFPIELGLSEVETISGERLFCGFVRDLTNQKKYEEALKQKERFTDGIIEASFDSMFAIDEIGIIQRVNAAASRQFGWSREEFIGQNISMIMPARYAEEHDKYIKDYLQSGVSKAIGKQREVTAQRKDGSSFPVLLGLDEIKGPQSTSIFVAFIRDLTDQKKMMEIEIEKTAAEVLLQNILPEEIALRLKRDPSHIADHHKSAVILFADIVGFTSMSSTMEPAEVVKMLNDLFSMFDDLVEKYDLNKVKTIGDCYMVTSVPVVEHEQDECSRVCHFALDMMDAIHLYNQLNQGAELSLRVGINVGPVVAGVVGIKRFFYDLWGDAVNIASRMESTGEAGKIQVTKDVVELVGDVFTFERRGMTHVKGKGEMETYFLTQRRRRRSSFLSALPKGNRVEGQKFSSMTLLETLRVLEKSLESELGPELELELADTLPEKCQESEPSDQQT